MEALCINIARRQITRHSSSRWAALIRKIANASLGEFLVMFLRGGRFVFDNLCLTGDASFSSVIEKLSIIFRIFITRASLVTKWPPERLSVSSVGTQQPQSCT